MANEIRVFDPYWGRMYIGKLLFYRHTNPKDSNCFIYDLKHCK